MKSALALGFVDGSLNVLFTRERRSVIADDLLQLVERRNGDNCSYPDISSSGLKRDCRTERMANDEDRADWEVIQHALQVALLANPVRAQLASRISVRALVIRQ